MNHTRPGRLNVKLLLILCGIVVIGGAGFAGVHYARKQAATSRALAEARAAAGRQDWPTAARRYRHYLSDDPDNAEVLAEYARAQTEVQPATPQTLGLAIGAYRRLIRLEPDNREAYEELATLYTATSRFGELAHIAGLRLANAPNDAAAVLWRTSALAAQGRHDDARAQLESLVSRLESQPDAAADYVEACMQLSRLAELEGQRPDYATARQWLDRAIERDASAPEALARRARATRLWSLADPANDPNQAAELATADLAAADKLQPADPRVRLLLSQEWLEHEELDRAEAELRAVEQMSTAQIKEFFLQPQDWTALEFMQRAAIALARETPEQAVPLADQALVNLTEKIRRDAVLPVAVEVYIAAGRLDEARRRYNEYIESRLPQDAKLRYSETASLLRALLARAGAEPYGVIEALEPYADRDVSRPKMLKMLGEAYSETGQSRRATAALQRYLQHRPRDRETMLQLVREYMKNGDWDAALEAARLAESRFSDAGEAKLLRAEAAVRGASTPGDLRDKVDFGALEAELTELRERSPESAEVAVLQAALAAQLGRADDALAILRQAVDRVDDALPIRLALANLLFRAGRPDEAIAAARDACEFHPDDALPWLTLADVLTAAERLDQVPPALGAALEQMPEGAQRRSVAMRLARHQLRHRDRQAGIELLSSLAAEAPADIDVRSVLLDLPEVLADDQWADRLIAQIRDTQGDSGLLWRVHEAARWLSRPEAWRSKQGRIRELLDYCVDADPGWPAPVLLLADLHDRLGTAGAMEAVYRRALSVNPRASQIAERFLSLLTQQGRYADARKELERLSTTASIRPDMQIDILMKDGAWAEAAERVEQQVEQSPNDPAARIVLARLKYEQDQDAQDALAQLDKAAELGAAAFDLAEARSRILNAAGRTDEARRVLDGLVENHPTLDALRLRGAFLSSIDDAAAARRDFERAAELADDGRGYAWLGAFYVESGRADDAIEAWEQGLAAHPGDHQLQRRLVPALLERGREQDRRRAEELIASLESRFDDPGVWWLRALARLHDGTPGSTEEARLLLQRVVDQNPTAVDAFLSLIELAMQRGDYSAARDLANQARGANPNDGRLILARARAELALDNIPLALELARSALRDSPNSRDALTVFTEVAVNQKDAAVLREALASLERALSSNPHDEQLQRAAARTLSALGKPGDAVARLERYVQSTGRPAADVLLLLAELHHDSGDARRLADVMERLADAHGENPKVIRALLLWSAQRRDYARVAQIAGGLDLTDSRRQHLALLAASILASQDAGELQTALELYDRLAAAAPDLLDARLGQALTAFRLGQTEQAIKLYESLLVSEPANPRVLNDFAWVLARGPGDYRRALDLADRGLRSWPDNAHLRDTRGEILMNMPGRLQDARREFERCLALADHPATRARASLKLASLCRQADDLAEMRRHLDEVARIERERRVLGPEELKTLQELTAAGNDSTG